MRQTFVLFLIKNLRFYRRTLVRRNMFYASATFYSSVYKRNKNDLKAKLRVYRPMVSLFSIFFSRKKISNLWLSKLKRNKLKRNRFGKKRRKLKHNKLGRNKLGRNKLKRHHFFKKRRKLKRYKLKQNKLK